MAGMTKSNQNPESRDSSGTRAFGRRLRIVLECAAILLFTPALACAQGLTFNFAQSLYNADVTISSDPTSNGSFSISSPGVFTPFSNANTATVNVTDLIGLLNTGTSVTINTANASGTGIGNIGMASAMTWTGISPSVGLNLNASNDVNINGALTATTGSFKFSAYDNVNIGGAMTATTGNMTFLAGNNVNLNSAASITTGDFTAIAGGVASMNAPITVVSGNTTVVSGAAPEIDGALLPQVALLLGCLYLMFGRKRPIAGLTSINVTPGNRFI